MFFRRKKPIPYNIAYDTDAKRNYSNLKDAIENKKAIIGRYPLNVQIQTISACNGKCGFCPYQGSWQEKNRGKMSWETYEKLIKNLKNYKIRKFCPYFENEPLLDPGLFEKIRYAVDNLNPEYVELSTNLSVLTDDKLREIEEVLPKIPHLILISFHGVSKESYQDIMGLDFDRSLNNVLRLVELSQKVPLRISIHGAGAPMLPETNLKNWFGKDEYLAFWGKNISRFKNRPDIFFFTYHDRASSEQLKKRGMSFSLPHRRNLENFYCVRFDRWLHFLHTGEPILCCMDYNKETGFGGKIQDKSVEELFASPCFLDLIKKGSGLVDSREDFICKRCISPGG